MADDRNEATQGKAVEEALNGDNKRETDRWEAFSEKETRERAQEPALPEGAEKPLAGLARSGGVVDKEPGEGEPRH